MPYVARGYHAVGEGKFQASVPDFDQAIALDPKNANAYYGRGLAYGAVGQIDRSIRDHQKAVELNPQNAMAYFGLGLKYHDKGQNDRAVASFSKAIERDPKYAQALYNRGNAYGARKSRSTARSPITALRSTSSRIMRKRSSCAGTPIATSAKPTSNRGSRRGGPRRSEI